MKWTVILALAAVCTLMRVIVPLGLGQRRPAWLDRALERAVPGLLAALVATGAATNGHHLHPDARLAGLVSAAIAVALRAPPLLILLTAASATAILRIV